MGLIGSAIYPYIYPQFNANVRGFGLFVHLFNSDLRFLHDTLCKGCDPFRFSELGRFCVIVLHSLYLLFLCMSGEVLFESLRRAHTELLSLRVKAVPHRHRHHHSPPQVPAKEAKLLYPARLVAQQILVQAPDLSNCSHDTVLHLKRQFLLQGVAPYLFQANIGRPVTPRLSLIPALRDFVSELDRRATVETAVGLLEEKSWAVGVWRNLRILRCGFFNGLRAREVASGCDGQVAEGRREGGQRARQSAAGSHWEGIRVGISGSRLGHINRYRAIVSRAAK